MSHHNGIDEAKWVVDNIQKLMAQDRCVICIVCPLSLGLVSYRDLLPCDVAVLARTSSVLAPVRDELRSNRFLPQGTGVTSAVQHQLMQEVA